MIYTFKLTPKQQKMIKNVSLDDKDYKLNVEDYKNEGHLDGMEVGLSPKTYDKYAKVSINNLEKSVGYINSWINYAIAGDSMGYSNMMYAPKQKIAFICKKSINGNPTNDINPNGMCMLDKNETSYISYNKKNNTACFRDADTNKIISNFRYIDCRSVNKSTIEKYAVGNYWNSSLMNLDFTFSKKFADTVYDKNSEIKHAIPYSNKKNGIKGYLFVFYQ